MFPWSRKKKQQSVASYNQSNVVIMQSQCLGMTIIEEGISSNTEMKEIAVEEWIQILQNQQLSGYPLERIYFSFLKGIPNFLRLKIWLLLCSQNNSKNFKYSSKNDEPKKKGSYLKVQDITPEVYMTLCANEPLQKQVQQIQKDVKRSFSSAKTKYKYLQTLLRKMLYASSNSGIQYSQGMNYILLNLIIYCLQSLGINQANIDGMQPHYERDIFVIYRETIMKMEDTFGQNNIFKVIKQLQQKLAESVPQILFIIYKNGLDCFSAFSQNYFSVMSYNDPPQQLCKLMLDLFFLTGEKAIHAVTVKMLEITHDKILKMDDPQKLQKFLKSDIYFEYYREFVKEKQSAKSIQDFGLCFFDSIERVKM